MMAILRDSDYNHPLSVEIHMMYMCPRVYSPSFANGPLWYVTVQEVRGACVGSQLTRVLSTYTGPKYNLSYYGGGPVLQRVLFQRFRRPIVLCNSL